MRKRFRVLVLAAILAALVVPLGFALSRDTDSIAVASHIRGASVVASNITATAPVVVGGKHSASAALLPSLPDGAKLLFVGTVLFGLAAAMRRSV